MNDLFIVSSIIFFLTILGFFSLMLPPAYQFLSVTSLTWFSGGTIAVAGTCVIATGLPCAGALVLYTVVSILTTYFATSFTWFETLLLTPISLILVVFISRLARGSG